MTVSYVVDGKTYTYELDDSAVLNSINLDSLDLSNIRFIDWNSGFDNPISMPQGFGDGSAGSFSDQRKARLDVIEKAFDNNK